MRGRGIGRFPVQDRCFAPVSHTSQINNRRSAIVDQKSWQMPEVFQWLQKEGDIATREMLTTFNCGIGMVLIVGDKAVDDVMLQLAALGESAHVIGEIARRQDTEKSVEIDCR